MEGDTQQWDYSVFWQEALNQVRAHISEQEYVMWFRNIQYYASRQNEIILAVPSSFYRDQVKQRYLKIIQDTLFDLSGMSIQVSFEIVKLQPPADHSAGTQHSEQDHQVVDKSNYNKDAMNSDHPTNHPNLQVPGSASSQAPRQGASQEGAQSSSHASPFAADHSSRANSKAGSEAKSSPSQQSTQDQPAAHMLQQTQSAGQQAHPAPLRNQPGLPAGQPATQSGGQPADHTTQPGQQADHIDHTNQQAQQAAQHSQPAAQTNQHSQSAGQTAAHTASSRSQPLPQLSQPTAHKAQTAQTAHASRQMTMRKHNELRLDYSFENFIVGDNNSFAANACIAISKNPGTAYNPCLIYGGVGLGKTHLIQSIGNYVHNTTDKTRVVYVTAETFTNEFIQAIRDGKNHQFKNRYRNVDVLLIDDIHFLQSKDQTQEELFHTFNALYDSNKQMVFTCDRPVSELKNLTDRLRSRFERGLNVDLQPPDFETRYAILKRKVDEKKAAIDEKVIELISKNITTNVRDLEAALTKLMAYSDILNKTITVDIAQEQLKDVFSSPKQSNITIEIIQRAVGDYFNLSPYDLRGKKRTKAIAFPRQIAMYITREITEYSTTEVGLEFGGRDHTTVMHACQRIESRMQADPYLEPTIQRLIRQIKEYGTR
ncbi:MAG: chromosomal replication initiator protein DnaA [Spirochaetaceae bacterium]|nr:chromosomal replication initiator protein DnaA [Spirochaetaceae bacterium]MCF7949568.1 chromosomal replication initiator protein DnaA [Spirochaetia bacterium]MCF7952325.1 chromosomal replication initiator protein DnaA [Spirochaetaceae bacterium]